MKKQPKKTSSHGLIKGEWANVEGQPKELHPQLRLPVNQLQHRTGSCSIGHLVVELQVNGDHRERDLVLGGGGTISKAKVGGW